MWVLCLLFPCCLSSSLCCCCPIMSYSKLVHFWILISFEDWSSLAHTIPRSPLSRTIFFPLYLYNNGTFFVYDIRRSVLDRLVRISVHFTCEGQSISSQNITRSKPPHCNNHNVWRYHDTRIDMSAIWSTCPCIGLDGNCTAPSAKLSAEGRDGWRKLD
jgi:hypothetical protein